MRESRAAAESLFHGSIGVPMRLPVGRKRTGTGQRGLRNRAHRPVCPRARNESTRAVVKRACAPGKSYRTGRKRDEGNCDLCARPSREQPPLSVEDAKADAEGYSLPLLAEGV